MSSFFESCKSYYGTEDLYQVLRIKKSSSSEEIKKAYKKLSLEVHPDRVLEEDKENATEKFKILGKIYSILSDEEKRKVYDETGSLDDEDGDLSDRDWSQYWRVLFKEISFDDIVEYEKKYKNGEEELEDLKQAYTNGKGSMDFIYDHVPFASPEDDDRLRSILQKLIDEGELPKFKAFINDTPRKQETRKRKKMSEEKFVIRGLLRHYWKKGLSAKAAAEEICAVEGENFVHRNTAAYWFRRFNSGNNSLLDEPRSGRPSEVDDAELLQTVTQFPYVTTRGLSFEMGVSNATVSRHLKRFMGRHASGPHDLSSPQASSKTS